MRMRMQRQERRLGILCRLLAKFFRRLRRDKSRGAWRGTLKTRGRRALPTRIGKYLDSSNKPPFPR
jgi:hypothetical protein